MKYNFDETINRDNTFAVKTNGDVVKQTYNLNTFDDTIYLWVADMDFQCAPKIQEALANVSKNKIFGYTAESDEFKTTLMDWYKRRHNMNIDKDWLVYSTGTVTGIAEFISVFSNIGDGVIIQSPVYYPFAGTINRLNRKIAENPLIKKDGKYEIDFEQFEELCKKEENKLFIFCNPHNPIGQIWSHDDVEKMAAICEKYEVLVFSDEIHCDIIRKDAVFTPMMNTTDYKGVVTATATNKTFNMAGLHATQLIMPCPKMRAHFAKYASHMMPTPFTVSAVIAAYRDSEDWCIEMNEYIDANFDFIDEFVKKELPNVKFNKPEGTYFVWLDFRYYGLDGRTLLEKFADEAHLIVENGADFGKDGEGFIRINIASPKAVVVETFERIKKMVDAF